MAGGYGGSDDVAREAVGGHVRFTITITPRDANSNAATNLTLRGDASGNWLIGDQEPWQFQSGFTNRYVESGVLDWGEVSQGADIGSAFGTVSDVRLVLANNKVSGQQDNSTYTFSSGSPAMDPEPTGDGVRLSEVLQHYTILGSYVSYTVYFFNDGDTTSVGSTESINMLTGIIEEVDLSNPDLVALDITQETATENTRISGREITDPPNDQGKGQYAPIAYGDFGEDAQAASAETLISDLDARVVAGFKPSLVPVIPWKQDGENVDLIYTDCEAPNVSNQVTVATKTGNLYTFHNPGVSILRMASNSTTVNWTSLENPYPTSTETEQSLEIQEQQTAIAYIPAYRLLEGDGWGDSSGSEGSGSWTPTNPEKAWSRDPTEAFVMPVDDLGSGNTDRYINLMLSPSPSLGQIRTGDERIFGYVVIDSTVTTGVTIRFGLFSVAGSEWLGLNGGASTGVYGTLASGTGAGGIETEGLKRQDERNSVTIAEQSYFADGTGYAQPEPLKNWQWESSDKVGSGAPDAVVLRIEVNAHGAANDELHILDAGIALDYVPGAYNNATESAGFKNSFDAMVKIINEGRERGPVPFPGGGGAIFNPPIWQGGQAVRNRYRNINSFISANVTTIDDAGGTVTGTGTTAGTPSHITNPAHIADDLGRAWGNNIPTFTTSTGQFGSSQLAADEIDAWVSDLTGASEYRTHMVIEGPDSYGSLCDRLCKQSPMMVHRNPENGNIYTVAYPEDAPGTTKSGNGYMRLYDADSNLVKFHAGLLHEGSSSVGKLYGLHRFGARLTPLSDIFNQFRLRYRVWPGDGSFQWTQFVNETNADSSVWGGTGTEAEPTSNPSDLASNIGGGYNLSTICSTSQSMYGVKRMMELDLPDISYHPSATAFLHYLIKRYTAQRIITTATAGQEAMHMLPGHIIRFADDVNLILPRMDYLNEPAKATGWSGLDFFVTGVSKRIEGGTVLVDFTAEQIVYDPS